MLKGFRSYITKNKIYKIHTFHAKSVFCPDTPDKCEFTLLIMFVRYPNHVGLRSVIPVKEKTISLLSLPLLMILNSMMAPSTASSQNLTNPNDELVGSDTDLYCIKFNINTCYAIIYSAKSQQYLR